MANHTEKHIDISDDFWSEKTYGRVAKVILKGVGAYSLPPDAFLNALQEHGIIKKENVNQVQVMIHASKRKRFVYMEKLRLNTNSHLTCNIKVKLFPFYLLILVTQDQR